MSAPSDGGAAKKPGQELFEAVQRLQGFSYISDAHFDKPLDRVLGIAECALANTEATATVLRRFIKKHESARASAKEGK